VRPKFAGNIGACARLASNFGVTDIWLVAPECPPDWKSSEQVQAFATGQSSQTLIDFQETQSLREALAPCTRAVAFTRRPRDRFPLDVLFSEVFLPIGEQPSQPHHIRWPEASTKIALVFGNEKTGLTDIEIQECQQCVRIATSSALGSMNLSHAVAVVLARLFEWAEQATPELTPPPDDRGKPKGRAARHLRRAARDVATLGIGTPNPWLHSSWKPEAYLGIAQRSVAPHPLAAPASATYTRNSSTDHSHPSIERSLGVGASFSAKDGDYSDRESGGNHSTSG